MTFAMTFLYRTFFVCAAMVLLFIAHTGTAFAQTAGAQLIPAKIENAVNPGDVIEETLKVRNVTSGEQTFYLIKKDIVGVRDDNSPLFADENAEPTIYALSTWITISEEPITLAPGATVEVPIKIVVPDNASPGSHFGGVFVSVEPPRLRQTGAAVGYEIGTIVSLRIKGDVIENARIRAFSTDKLVYGKPLVKFITRVENPGNVMITPHGPLEVFNMFGKRITLITVNDSLGGVFPGTTRSYETTWEEKDFAFGRYQGVVSLIYGEKGYETTVSATVSFWVLPANIILPILGILAFVILAVYFGVRVHIKRTLDKYQVGGRRTAVYRRRDTGMTRLAVVAIALLAAVTLFLVAILIVFA